MVFYRKYRPQNIQELDIAQIRQNLGEVLSSENPPHAFLFTGPRGLGKTSAARIVAKSINCLEGKKGAICGKCSSCQSITQGTNLDVLEIDAASNRGIDEIRDLREKIRLAPSSARFKVYIIDEVHMLTTEAFNALLKTLEEPPDHALFVLCTTESQKLPATIISRCLRFDFKRAGSDDLVRSLERIIKGEKLKVEKEALQEIVKGADGSFRDAAKILEQASVTGRVITQEQIRQIMGETANLKPEELLKFLSQKDTRGAISEINRLVEAGENLRVYTEKILSILHAVLMAKIGVEEEVAEASLVGLFEKEEIVQLIEIFSHAHGEFKAAVLPQLPLELAAVAYCEKDEGAAPSVPAENAPAVSPPFSEKREESPPKEKTEKRQVGSNVFAKNQMEQITSLWPKIIEETKKYNHTLSGVLRGCRPQSFDGKMLTIETSYQFHKDKLTEPKVRGFLNEAIAEVLGGEGAFKCILAEKRKVGDKNV